MVKVLHASIALPTVPGIVGDIGLAVVTVE